MKIAVTMLAGGNREHLHMDALACVDAWTDAFILIDTGPSAQRAIEMAVEKYGDKVIVRKCHQDPFMSCCEGRNQSLDEAAALGFDWQLILDTDMRLDLRGDDVRALLASTDANIVSFRCPPGCEWKRKPLLYRLPGDYGRWMRDPHEFFATHCRDVLLPRALYWETGHHGQEAIDRHQSIVDQILAQPPDGRNLWYLGDSLEGLGRYDEAIEAYYRATQYGDPMNSGSAWWRIARIRERLGQRVAVIDACDRGLQFNPDFPEFDWLAAVHEFWIGHYAQAAARAEKAARNGERTRANDRDSWGCWLAWYEGPHDVLRHSYLRLGNTEAANAHDALFRTLQAERLRVA